MPQLTEDFPRDKGMEGKDPKVWEVTQTRVPEEACLY